MVAVLLPEWLRFIDSYYLILYALLVMGLLIYSPTGLIGIFERYMRDRNARAASARARRPRRVDREAVT